MLPRIEIMPDERNGNNLIKNGKNLLSTFGTGQLVAYLTVIGALITVYADIRSNLDVANTKVTQLTADLAHDRAARQAFESEIRSQLGSLSNSTLSQLGSLSNDLSYLKGQLQRVEERKK